MVLSDGVTVIIPTFNRENYISYCIDSILSQSIKPDQVIVVVDGSTDNTLDVLSKYDGKIEVFKKENGGKPKALNYVLPKVKYKYTWIMDDDDIALNDAVENHLNYLTDGGADFSYSHFYRGNEDPVDPGKLHIYKEERPLKVKSEDLFVRLLTSCFVGHPAVMAKTECYLNLGGFDEDLFRCQDYEMILRLAYNYRGVYVDKPTFICRTHSGQRGTQNFKFETSERREVSSKFNKKFIKKYYENLSIDEYITSDIKKLPFEIQKRALYVQRAVIMARHCLWKKFFDDMNTVCLITNEIQKELSSAEIDLLKYHLNYLEWWKFSEIEEFINNEYEKGSVRLDNIVLSILFGASFRQVYYHYKDVKVGELFKILWFFLSLFIDSRTNKK